MPTAWWQSDGMLKPRRMAARICRTIIYGRHSLGEYTALAAANAIDFSTAVYLAKERGRLMYEAG